MIFYFIYVKKSLFYKNNNRWYSLMPKNSFILLEKEFFFLHNALSTLNSFVGPTYKYIIQKSNGHYSQWRKKPSWVPKSHFAENSHSWCFLQGIIPLVEVLVEEKEFTNTMLYSTFTLLIFTPFSFYPSFLT